MLALLQKELWKYGVSEDAIVSLRDGVGPDQLPYLDLILKSGDVPFDAVVEFGGQPLAYVVDARDQHFDAGRTQEFLKLAAFRADAQFVAIIDYGRLTLHKVAILPKDLKDTHVREFTADEDSASTAFFQVYFSQEGADPLYLENQIFDLMLLSIEALVQGQQVSHEDAIALTGRAVFARFLIDRGILTSEVIEQIVPGQRRAASLFTTPRATASTCDWIDKVFNGDFLTLSSPDVISNLRGGQLSALSDIMNKSPHGQLQLDWGHLDFAHIPTGVLSQVYERHAEMWTPHERRQEGVYYTPARLAEYVIRQVFESYPATGTRRDNLSVLDPAVGGGVFLVAAFKALLAAKWEHLGRPPETSEIRQVMYDQLTGFDVNSVSLQLCALSLYLAALEFDTSPEPLEALRFEALRDNVLFNVSNPNDDQSLDGMAGSLGPNVPQGHDSKYDIVVGNPPWTPLKGDVADIVKSTVAESVRRIDPDATAASVPVIPWKKPDLAFVWQATRWAKSGGRIGMIIHGGHLFSRAKISWKARQALFSRLQITGILNGADLGSTNVWPSIDQPFAILFAANQRPSSTSRFTFVSPYQEKRLNKAGQFRIDPTDAKPIPLKQAAEVPHLLKTLYEGSWMDFQILQQVEKFPPLLETLEDLGFEHGQGFIPGTPKTDKNEHTSLRDQPELSSVPPLMKVTVENTTTYRPRPLQWERKEEIYSGPLLLVREALPLRALRAHVYLGDKLVFDRKFFGVSATRVKNGSDYVTYLCLLVNSQVFLWYALVTSGRFGLERRRVEKRDLMRFPVPPLASLSKKLKNKMWQLIDAIDNSDLKSTHEQVDLWAASVYGLDRWSLEVIQDTVRMRLPFRKFEEAAESPPTEQEQADFVHRLLKQLGAFTEGSENGGVYVQRLSRQRHAPWSFLHVSTAEGFPCTKEQDFVLELSRQLADGTAASQILIPCPEKGGVIIGLLNQSRYWTLTRARSLAVQLLHEPALMWN